MKAYLLDKKFLSCLSRTVVRNGLLMLGGLLILFFVVLALLAPILAPPAPGRDPFMMPSEWSPRITPLPPSDRHPFGTTPGLHYDIYYGCIWGTVIALRVGFLVSFGAFAFGLVVGTLTSLARAHAGYIGGIIDELVTETTTLVSAIGIVIALALIVVVPFNWEIGPLKFELTTLDKTALALVVVAFPLFAIKIGKEILRFKRENWTEISEVFGYSNIREVNASTRNTRDLMCKILVLPFLGFGPVVLAATTLGFLGIGSPWGYADWGRLIAFSRDWIISSGAHAPLEYWYTYIIPGLFLFTFVLGWVLFGVGLRKIVIFL